MEQIINILQQFYQHWDVPVKKLEAVAFDRQEPFIVLLACLLSLRTKDTVTTGAVQRLLQLAQTPCQMLPLSEEQIRQAIYPVGFYRRKAATLLRVCRQLEEQHQGLVPDNLEQLLQLPGVGRKTANLVLSRGFGQPAICVDTHVHRITNRWGYVQSRNVRETEQQLCQQLPPEFWIPLNRLLVAFGQAICRPVSPWCSQCPIRTYCARQGVEQQR